MAITTSGLFGLTLEKLLNATSMPANGLESESAVKVLLVTDDATPDFDTDAFRDDIEGDEVSGSGYSAGGVTLTSTELTAADGVLTYDAADVSWPNSTITDAMAAVGYIARGGTSDADELVFLSDFVSPVSSSNGTLSVQWNEAGIFTVQYVPSS